MIYVLIALSWMLGAACNAIMDVVNFKYKISIFKNMNPDFWNAGVSWRNKYKNGKPTNGPKFFGSTTFLVFVTDAWHLFQFLSNSFAVLTLLLCVYSVYPIEWYIFIGAFALLKMVWGTTFELLYGNMYKK